MQLPSGPSPDQAVPVRTSWGSKVLVSRILIVCTLGFIAGIAAFVGCATSDQSLEAQMQLDEITKAPRKQAECKPGTVAPCYGGPQGTAGRGPCKEGTRRCDAEGRWGKCDGEVRPEMERCNRLDDDCDGIIDNNFEREGAICFVGEGTCRTQGKWECSKDGSKAECSAPTPSSRTEICDGKDNDCDGQIDEGDLEGTGSACSTAKAGVCNAGTKRCVAGAIHCVQNVQGSIEICNKADDDCDNLIDEQCVTADEAAKARQQQ